MNSLCDDVLLIVFKQFNLNQQSILRLVNKRFNQLCDLILIDKLIIFGRRSPSIRQLELIDEKYLLENDTVRVNNLKKFFKNQKILNQLKKIRMLVIFGREERGIKLNNVFENLEYLYLDYVTFAGAKLLMSSKIRTLILNWADFEIEKDTNQLEEFLESFSNLSHMPLHYEENCYTCQNIISKFGFNQLKSHKIESFSSNEFTNYSFYRFCIENHLFDELKYLKLFIDEIKILTYIVQHCHKLRRIDCVFGLTIDDFLQKINEEKLSQLKSKSRADLLIYINGIELKSPQTSFVFDFFKAHKHFFPLHDSSIQLAINQSSIKCLRSTNEKQDLNEFYKLARYVYIYEQEAIDQTILRKLINSENLFIFLQNDPNARYMRFFFEINSIDTIVLQFRRKVNYGNEILDLLPKYSKQISNLKIENWNSINFDFLFELKDLRFFQACLYHPFNQDDFIKLIKNKNMVMIDLCFKRCENQTKEQLSSFKKVVKELSEQLEIKFYSFKIEIYTRKNNQFIRLFYQRGKVRIDNCEENILHKLAENKIFDVIEGKDFFISQMY